MAPPLSRTVVSLVLAGGAGAAQAAGFIEPPLPVYPPPIYQDRLYPEPIHPAQVPVINEIFAPSFSPSGMTSTRTP